MNMATGAQGEDRTASVQSNYDYALQFLGAGTMGRNRLHDKSWNGFYFLWKQIGAQSSSQWNAVSDEVASCYVYDGDCGDEGNTTGTDLDWMNAYSVMDCDARRFQTLNASIRFNTPSTSKKRNNVLVCLNKAIAVLSHQILETRGGHEHHGPQRGGESVGIHQAIQKEKQPQNLQAHLLRRAPRQGLVGAAAADVGRARPQRRAPPPPLLPRSACCCCCCCWIGAARTVPPPPPLPPPTQPRGRRPVPPRRGAAPMLCRH